MTEARSTPGIWMPIETAPKDGTPVRIKGLRFLTETPYSAVAAYTKRNCPAPTEDWFPPTDKADGVGPYMGVTHWQPLSTPPQTEGAKTP